VPKGPFPPLSGVGAKLQTSLPELSYEFYALASGSGSLWCVRSRPPRAGELRRNGVYSRPPFGGAEQALRYLGHYTHRAAISNHRLVSWVDDQITFRWRDSANNNQHKLMTLSLDEFLRRFLLHLLPKASSAFATLASSPTGGAPPSCPFAFMCSTQYSHRRPNQRLASLGKSWEVAVFDPRPEAER
jgi:hypothetical protein